MASENSGMQLLWVLAAAIATFVIARAGRDALRAPVLQRKNYADRDVATAGGAFAVFGFAVALGVHAAFDFTGANWQVSTAVVVFGFATVGVFDDLVGTHLARGLRGHLRAATRGQLTSGAIKLLVGLAVACIATVPFSIGTERRVLCVVLVAGSANAANLFDLAPGRATKVSVVVAIALAVAAGTIAGVLGPLLFVGAVVALLPAELDERLMLGDAGANPLGGVLGLLAIAAAGDSRAALWVAAAAVVAINVAGEVVSFSQVIARVPPLRALDQLGRRR
jgi:UDP-N-acetylmuramyl pentapeptide phosphotransferase/UDP-N-acetylglucosamine-1-phosphate transferase